MGLNNTLRDFIFFQGVFLREFLFSNYFLFFIFRIEPCNNPLKLLIFGLLNTPTNYNDINFLT